MVKEDLKELGLEDETVNKVWEMVSKNFVTKVRFNEVNNEKNALKSTLEERDSQLEELKKSNSNSAELQAEIEKLQQENKTKQKQYEADILKIKTDTAIERILTESKAKNQKAVKALLDLENIELEKDGSVKGLDMQIKKLKESEDSAFLFDSEEEQSNNTVGFTPGEKGDTSGNMNKTIEEMSNMSYAEYKKYRQQNN